MYSCILMHAITMIRGHEFEREPKRIHRKVWREAREMIKYYNLKSKRN